MISVFDAGNTNFTGNGDAVLMPTACSHRQAAAGKYDLTITHPVDPTGKWMHILPEAIIRAPVPEERIENAFSGLEADLYRTNTEAALREDTYEPYIINYETWEALRTLRIYAVGDRVTYINKNYQMTALDPGSEMNYNHPPDNYPEYWTEISRWGAGAPVIVNLKSGTDLYYVEAADAENWAKVSTMYGLEGYIKTSQITFVQHLTPEETQPRTITEQLFRIKRVTRSTDGKSVTATAEHVSYDLSGVLIDDASIHQANAARALALIEQAMMMDYRGMIATDMTSDDDGTYTGDIKGKNATYSLLDPDKGIVASFGAMYRRDNWDVFVLRRTETDRGFRLQYRRNMLGVNWDMRSDGLVTRVVPVARDEDGSDLYLDNDGLRWIDSPLIGNYPVIRMERIKVAGQVGKDDGTETATNWTVQTLRARMEEAAEERFTVDKADQVAHEITVDFEMLGATEEYQALRQLEHVLLYDTVTCINEEIGLSVTAEVVELEYDCIRKKVTGLKLSNVNAYGGRNVSGFNVFNNSITGDKLTDDAGDQIAENAADKAGTHTDLVASNLYFILQQWVTDHFQPIS